MRKKSWKIKAGSLPFAIVTLIIGFGVGYTAHEWGQIPEQHPQPAVQSIAKSAPVNLKSSVFVCFTPGKKCQLKIVDQIAAAKKSIFVQAYSFTDKEIAASLATAGARGVQVKVLLDKSNLKDDRSAKNILLSQNIPVRFDAPSGIAHNKIMIIDEHIIISGSYNYSAAAYKRNTENVLVIDDANLARAYLQNWQNRWQISK